MVFVVCDECGREISIKVVVCVGCGVLIIVFLGFVVEEWVNLDGIIFLVVLCCFGFRVFFWILFVLLFVVVGVLLWKMVLKVLVE